MMSHLDAPSDPTQATTISFKQYKQAFLNLLLVICLSSIALAIGLAIADPITEFTFGLPDFMLLFTIMMSFFVFLFLFEWDRLKRELNMAPYELGLKKDYMFFTNGSPE
jgi:hypothetical protein